MSDTKYEKVGTEHANGQSDTVAPPTQKSIVGSICSCCFYRKHCEDPAESDDSELRKEEQIVPPNILELSKQKNKTFDDELCEAEDKQIKDFFLGVSQGA